MRLMSTALDRCNAIPALADRHTQNIVQWENHKSRQPTMSDICRSLPSRRHALHGAPCEYRLGMEINRTHQSGTLNADALQALPGTSSKLASKFRTVIHNRTKQ